MTAPKTAMVLAAGLGTRMRPLTNDRPKALVDVGDKALIDHMLDRLADAGVTRAVVNVHHFADQMTEHLSKRKDVEIVISDEREQLLETGGGVIKALPLLGDDPFFVVNTDVTWATAGFAHLVVDTRGQGSGWSTGATADTAGSGPAQPGFLTRGIEDPHSYFYRRAYVDTVRALGVLRAHELVDPARVVVAGASQGGGLALAVAALAGDSVAGLLCDVPFLCDFPRATVITDRDPYREIGNYLKTHRGRTERVGRTLAYFDGVHFAVRGRAPASRSVPRSLRCGLRQTWSSSSSRPSAADTSPTSRSRSSPRTRRRRSCR